MVPKNSYITLKTIQGGREDALVLKSIYAG
jgi:hypothetical protein